MNRLRRPFQIIRADLRAYLLINALVYGVLLLGMALALIFPDLHAARTSSFVDGRQGALVNTVIGSPWTFGATIFLVNVFATALLLIVLPSLVIPFAGLAVFVIKTYRHRDHPGARRPDIGTDPHPALADHPHRVPGLRTGDVRRLPAGQVLAPAVDGGRHHATTGLRSRPEPTRLALAHGACALRHRRVLRGRRDLLPRTPGARHLTVPMDAGSRPSEGERRRPPVGQSADERAGLDALVTRVGNRAHEPHRALTSVPSLVDHTHRLTATG